MASSHPDFDPVHYYAFVLEALSRFGHEGMPLHVPRALSFLRKRKPAGRLLQAVAERLAPADRACAPGIVLEFGVYKGASLRMLARLFPECRVYGFDTFSGFPDDGRQDWRQNLATRPPLGMPANVELVIGRFEQTLAPFLDRIGTFSPRLVHVDCDLFSAARTALFGLGHRLGPGSVIVFDELLNYDEFAENELLALYLFLRDRRLDFEWFVTVGEAWPFEKACAGVQPAGAFEGYREHGCYQNAAIRFKSDTDLEARLAPFRNHAGELARLRPLRQPLRP